MKTGKLFLFSLAAGILFSCGDSKQENKKGKGIELANMDTTADPRSDFFQYVNGNWIKNNPVPESESSWGNFQLLRDKNKANLKMLVEEAASNTGKGDNWQKIGDFYFTAMDSASLEKNRHETLTEHFTAINGLKDKKELAKVVAQMHMKGVAPLFFIFIEPDFKNTTVMLTNVYQGGLGLPDRDYYLKPDAASENIRKEYHQHLAKMFELMGEKPEAAQKYSGKIINIETGLAEGSMTRVEQRDPNAVYHKMKLEELAALAPSFDWNQYFQSAGIQEKEFNVAQPEFVKALEKQLREASLDDWKVYLHWHLMHESAPYLSQDFVSENFRMYGTVLNGTKEMKPRWKRGIETIDRALGEALGQIYVEKFFSADAKKKVNEMVDNITEAFRERINTREWMSTETKKQALAKLDAIVRKLAYPDKWRDYSTLEIKRDAYVLNVFRASEMEFKRAVNKLGKPIDKSEWGMSPPTVNAYYNPLFNEIVFPAGIMLSPFFDPETDDAVNYGAIGAVIGHELTHGFDDQGCQFDKDGNLKNWWTEEDSRKFKEKTKILVNQFNSFVAIDTNRVNGELTLGENIADLGGLTIAYYALKKSLAKNNPGKIDDFTPEQRFFISWAQAWRGHMRPEALKQMLITNPHSPGKFRVLGPLANMKEFHDAFAIQENDPMFLADTKRAEIW